MTELAMGRLYLVFCIGIGGWVVTSAQAQGDSQSEPSQRIELLCTFLPTYVFTLNVVGQAPGVAVELMAPSDSGCPHNYALRTSDAKRIARADVIIANGLGMEPFLDELLKVNPKAKVLTISDDCALITCNHDHESEGAETDHDHKHGPVNGHVWVSPRQAILQVRTLIRKLSAADPAEADAYRANGEAFLARLQSLKDRLESAASGFRRRKIVTSHDAFAYLARDLDLDVVAMLETEPGREPSARRMAEIVKIIRNSEAAAIFYEPGSSQRLADTIAREAGVPSMALNPFSSLNQVPRANSYEEVMNDNLEILKKALGGGP